MLMGRWGGWQVLPLRARLRNGHEGVMAEWGPCQQLSAHRLRFPPDRTISPWLSWGPVMASGVRVSFNGKYILTLPATG